MSDMNNENIKQQIMQHIWDLDQRIFELEEAVEAEGKMVEGRMDEYKSLLKTYNNSSWLHKLIKGKPQHPISCVTLYSVMYRQEIEKIKAEKVDLLIDLYHAERSGD